MKSWTIRQRILASFGIVLGLMVVMGLLALRNLENIDARAMNAALFAWSGGDVQRLERIWVDVRRRDLLRVLRILRRPWHH